MAFAVDERGDARWYARLMKFVSVREMSGDAQMQEPD